MRTEIYEADPFTSNKTTHFVTIDTDYRFEVRDEFFLTTEQGQRLKVRVVFLRLEVTATGMSRELTVMTL